MFYGREDVTFNNCKYNFFLQSQRKLSFLGLFLRIFIRYLIFPGKGGRIVEFLTTKRPSSFFPKKPYLIRLARFLVRLCLFKMISRVIRYTYTGVKNNLEKLSNKCLSVRFNVLRKNIRYNLVNKQIEHAF